MPYWSDDNYYINIGSFYSAIFLIVFTIFCSFFIFPKITGKEQYGEPITEQNSYSIAISSSNENNIAVQKIIDTDDDQYYVLTYLNKAGNFVFLKAPVVNTEILINYNSNDIAILETEETVICYNHTEITDRGNNFTYESEVNYTIYISDDLYYDQVN